MFLGNYVVDPNEGISKPSPLETQRDWRFIFVSQFVLSCFSSSIMNVMRSSLRNTPHLLYHICKSSYKVRSYSLKFWHWHFQFWVKVKNCSQAILSASHWPTVIRPLANCWPTMGVIVHYYQFLLTPS